MFNVGLQVGFALDPFLLVGLDAGNGGLDVSHAGAAPSGNARGGVGGAQEPLHDLLKSCLQSWRGDFGPPPLDLLRQGQWEDLVRGQPSAKVNGEIW